MKHVAAKEPQIVFWREWNQIGSYKEGCSKTHTGFCVDFHVQLRRWRGCGIAAGKKTNTLHLYCTAGNTTELRFVQLILNLHCEGDECSCKIILCFLSDQLFCTNRRLEISCHWIRHKFMFIYWGTFKVRDDTSAVVASKGSFSGDVRVEIEQRVPGRVPRLFQTVEADTVWHGHFGQILLGAGLHRKGL